MVYVFLGGAFVALGVHLAARYLPLPSPGGAARRNAVRWSVISLADILAGVMFTLIGWRSDLRLWLGSIGIAIVVGGAAWLMVARWQVKHRLPSS
jgi:hypothetical protein